jgi:thiol-disulfide isomerase/thioredoxin
MIRAALSLFFSLLAVLTVGAQQSTDPAAQALAQGDLYQSKRKYELAMEAYRKADKLAHHNSAQTYLKLASVERKLGDFSGALDDAKKAEKVAGGDKAVAIHAHLLRANLLTQMAGKTTDKKLKEAEEEIRQALALDSTNATARYDLGFVLLKQERDTEGVAELNTFVSMPRADTETVAEARRMIASPLRARAPFAPDFSFTTYQKQEVSNAALHGKVVLVDFWGTWCPPCRASVPFLRDLNKKYNGKAFQMVSVSSDDDEDVWKTFINAEHMDWSQYIDLPGQMLHAFNVDSFPTFVVLDKDGVIRFRQSGEGPTTEMELEDAINRYLKKESDPKLAAAAAAPKASVAAEPSVAAGSASPVTAVHSNAAAAGPAAAREPQGPVIEGNTYKNGALGMSFQFPQNWHAATPETLQALNERAEAAATASLAQQNSQPPGSGRVVLPKIIFYASRGGGDGQHLEIPSVRISATSSMGGESLDLEKFRANADKMASASGRKLAGPASEFQVNKHQFLRADFMRAVGALSLYQSYIQTLAGKHVVIIELFAQSAEELQQVAACLQSMSISDEE